MLNSSVRVICLMLKKEKTRKIKTYPGGRRTRGNHNDLDLIAGTARLQMFRVTNIIGVITSKQYKINFFYVPSISYGNRLKNDLCAC